MDRSSALRRLTGLARDDVIPAAQKLYWGANRTVEELAVKLLGADFDDRTRQLKERYEARGGDPFGLDPETTRLALAWVALFHRAYFRSEVFDIENVPEGKVLLVANHSGQLPLDGVMIGASMFLDGNPPRLIRAMVEKWVQTLPYLNVLFRRLGQVVGVPENCKRLLAMGEIILVFPEGARGISKPFKQRYQLQDFGLGFMRLAIETGTPIVPVGVVGAEEQYINLGNIGWAAKAMGMPVFPFIPQFLVPGAQLPLPSRYRIYFGEPLQFDGDADDDDAVIADQVNVVKQAIEGLLERGLAERESVFR